MTRQLTVTFYRDGRETSPGQYGSDTLAVLQLMLTFLDMGCLQRGDRFEVTEEKETDLPAVSRGSHYS
jgi:hypothetical protein